MHPTAQWGWLSRILIPLSHAAAPRRLLRSSIFLLEKKAGWTRFRLVWSCSQINLRIFLFNYFVPLGGNLRCSLHFICLSLWKWLPRFVLGSDPCMFFIPISKIYRSKKWLLRSYLSFLKHSTYTCTNPREYMHNLPWPELDREIGWLTLRSMKSLLKHGYWHERCLPLKNNYL
jgi:hypothetical protein